MDAGNTAEPFDHHPPGLTTVEISRQRRLSSSRQRWDRTARQIEQNGRGLGGYYYRRSLEVYRHLIPEQSRVLELGSGVGDLLAALNPSEGVGVDLSAEMVRIAAERHPHLEWVCGDAAGARGLVGDRKFDFVILSDLANEVADVQEILEEVKSFCTPRTRIILNLYSRVWELPLSLASRLKLARPLVQQNWLSPKDTAGLLHLSGFEKTRSWSEVLFPFGVPGVAGFCNKFLVRFWPFKELALAKFFVARLVPEPDPSRDEPTVTVVVAARNEEGNIQEIVRRTPQLGGGTELIFVEGGSVDQTEAKIREVAAANPQWGLGIHLYKQPGTGKGDAVREGFAHATGDVLMILDADMTVPPEDLPRFFDAIRSGRGEFINGVRLVYPMEDQAMRFLNLLGNKFFGMAFTWILGQDIKDTLCGTKVIRREDYLRLAQGRAYFGEIDPFGDFDLIFGAAKMNLKIIDLPVRYQARTYGQTNISRWSHGVLLLRMTMLAARKLKFV